LYVVLGSVLPQRKAALQLLQPTPSPSHEVYDEGEVREVYSPQSLLAFAAVAREYVRLL